MEWNTGIYIQIWPFCHSDESLPTCQDKVCPKTQSWIIANSKNKIIHHNLVDIFAFVGYIVCLWWWRCSRQNFRDRASMLMSSLCKQLFQISREKGRMSVATEWVSESALSEQVQAQQRATSRCWGNTQSTVNNCWSVNPVKVNKAVCYRGRTQVFVASSQ